MVKKHDLGNEVSEEDEYSDPQFDDPEFEESDDQAAPVIDLKTSLAAYNKTNKSKAKTNQKKAKFDIFT